MLHGVPPEVAQNICSTSIAYCIEYCSGCQGFFARSWLQAGLRCARMRAAAGPPGLRSLGIAGSIDSARPGFLSHFGVQVIRDIR